MAAKRASHRFDFESFEEALSAAKDKFNPNTFEPMIVRFADTIGRRNDIRDSTLRQLQKKFLDVLSEVSKVLRRWSLIYREAQNLSKKDDHKGQENLLWETHEKAAFLTLFGIFSSDSMLNRYIRDWPCSHRRRARFLGLVLRRFTDYAKQFNNLFWTDQGAEGRKPDREERFRLYKTSYEKSLDELKHAIDQFELVIEDQEAQVFSAMKPIMANELALNDEDSEPDSDRPILQPFAVPELIETNESEGMKTKVMDWEQPAAKKGPKEDLERMNSDTTEEEVPLSTDPSSSTKSKRTSASIFPIEAGATIREPVTLLSAPLEETRSDLSSTTESGGENDG